MNEKRYVVPEGMLDAVSAISYSEQFCLAEKRGEEPRVAVARIMLECALRWLSDHPMAPTTEQWGAIWKASPEGTSAKDRCIHWMRVMFLAPEPEVPEAVKDLMHENRKPYTSECTPEAEDERILEAYRRGRRSK